MREVIMGLEFRTTLCDFSQEQATLPEGSRLLLRQTGFSWLLGHLRKRAMRYEA
jgi:hypothetical protein